MVRLTGSSLLPETGPEFRPRRTTGGYYEPLLEEVSHCREATVNGAKQFVPR
jgi:hypothetical protein